MRIVRIKLAPTTRREMVSDTFVCAVVFCGEWTGKIRWVCYVQLTTLPVH